MSTQQSAQVTPLNDSETTMNPMTNLSTSTSSRLAGMVRLCVGSLALVATIAFVPDSASADEIVVLDSATGNRRGVRISDVTSESWAEVKYRTRAKGPELSIPARDIVQIVRNDSKEGARIAAGISELKRGALEAALAQFRTVHGAGITKDLDTDAEKFIPFTAGDPPGRNSRPSWESEYAHYYYSDALLRIAERDSDKDVFENVLLCLNDLPIPSSDKKETSGGFLDRFKDGASRWYPNAMLLKARALVGLKKYSEAKGVFDELYASALKVPLHPRWAYEGKAGLGRIEEAKGDSNKAESAYNTVATTMQVRLTKAEANVFREEYGRYFNLARSRMARIRLADAEKRNNTAAYQSLRAYMSGNTPEALRKQYKSKLNKEQLAAMVAGARDPAVQSVMLNGMGRAYLEEGNFEEALIRFRAVTIKYLLGDPDQSGRACYYLAKAAEGAAKAAKGEDVRKMYEGIKSAAQRTLKERFAKTSWASK